MAAFTGHLPFISNGMSDSVGEAATGSLSQCEGEYRGGGGHCYFN